VKRGNALAAFFPGLLSFFVFMVVGEAAMYHIGEAVGLIAALILMLAYFFMCQFFLSRGNPGAYRRDWPIMLALDAVPLLLVFIMALAERREVILSQGLGIGSVRYSV
jgi:hypothetical protein